MMSIRRISVLTRSCIPIRLSSTSNTPAIQNDVEEDEDLIKDKLLDASLSFVPQFGWSSESVEAAAESLGYSKAFARVVKTPDIELVHHHFVSSNLKLEESMCSQSQRDSFFRENIEARLRMNVPYMEQWPQALAIMATKSPLQSFKYGLELMDLIVHYSGDTKNDLSWYSKRICLGMLYKTTELAMLNDKSPDFEATWKFLDRRLKDQNILNRVVTDISDIPSTLGGVATTLGNIVGIRK